MNENSTYEKIENYLLRQMPSSERTAFEAQLKSDPALAQQFEQQKLEHKMMESLIEKDLLKDLDKWKQETDTNTAVPKTVAKEVSIFRNPSALAIAASIALLIAAFFWFNNSDNPDLPLAQNPETPENPSEINTPDPVKEIIETSPKEEIVHHDPPHDPPIKEPQNAPTPPQINDTPKPKNYIALANTYYETTDFGNVNLRGETAELTTAMQAIKDRDLNSAIAQLNSIITNDNTNLTAPYYLALVYNNQKKFTKAIPLLEKITASKTEFLFIDEVDWLLALAYLQDSKNDKAKAMLTTITTDVDHPYYSKASSLLNDLK